MPGRFGQPLAAWSIEEPLERQVFFLDTRIGLFELVGRRDKLVELSLQVAQPLVSGAGAALGRRASRRGWGYCNPS